MSAPAAHASDIAVVVATYRRAHLIGRALDSIAAQTRPPREIVVVDDASGDDTAAVVAAWARAHAAPVTFIAAETNGGAGVTRNLGMAATSSPLIGFLDSDDEYLPDALERLAAPFGDHRRAVVSFADAMQHWADGTPSRPMMRGCLSPDVDTVGLGGGLHRLADPPAALLTTSMIPTCAALFRRTAAEAVGWMPATRHGEDWIFWLKLAAQGEFLCRFDEVAIVHRDDDNLTGARHGTRHTQQLLAALLAIRDGRMGVPVPAAVRPRLDAAIAAEVAHWRYNVSRDGLSDYWRALGSAEGRETGGRWRHLLADPKGLARAAWFSRG